MKLFVIGTNVCNLECDFCINKTLKTLPSDLGNVIKSVEKFLGTGKCDKIMISGGEPLSDRKYFDAMLSAIKPYKDKVDIDLYTNGHLLKWADHKRLKASCRKLTYVFGVSPVPYKSLDVLLKNHVVAQLLDEDKKQVKVNYVIPSPDHIKYIEKDCATMDSLGMWYQLSFNKTLYKEAKNYYLTLRQAVLKTSYKPSIKDMPSAPIDCDMKTVETDGTVRGCGRNHTQERLAYADMFISSFCANCALKRRCHVCRPAIAIANFSNICLLNYALCANLSEEELK